MQYYQEEMGNICEIFISPGEKIEIKLKITAERLWEKLPQPSGFIKGKDPEKFLLVTGHLDAWEPGVTCNATGDASMLEMVRVFSKFKDELERSIWFVFLEWA